MTTTRFPNGITNVPKTNPLGVYESPDPTKWHQYFDDFDSYFSSEWDVSFVGAASEILSFNEDGGSIGLITDANNDDLVFLLKSPESFLIEVGKKTIFRCRFKIDDFVLAEFMAGLQKNDGVSMSTTDGIYFYKLHEGLQFDFEVKKNNVATSVDDFASAADNEYIEMAFVYNGVDKVFYYVNNEIIGSLGVENLPDDEELAITFGVQNKANQAETMLIDYVFAAKER
jgi:hypothetical protein